MGTHLHLFDHYIGKSIDYSLAQDAAVRAGRQSGKSMGMAIKIEAARRQARLAVILENLFEDSCYEHGDACQTKADCWAREIIAHESAWA